MLFYKVNVNKYKKYYINPLKAELIPICHQLTLLTANHILKFSRISFKIAMPVAKHMAEYASKCCLEWILSA
jgi:hypothetical protein